MNLQEKEIARNDFVSIFYDEHTKMLIHRWQDPEGKMQVNLSIFQENAQWVSTHQQELKPLRALVDTTELDLSFSVEIHQWGGEEIANAMIKGETKRLAFVESSDFFAKVSIQQLVKEAENPYFVINFFEREEDAINWLMLED